MSEDYKGIDEFENPNHKSSKEFAKLLNEQEKTTVQKGLTAAFIVKIEDERVWIDTQGKKEQFMPIDEIKDDEGNLLFKEKESIEVVFNNGKPSYKKALAQKRLVDFIDSMSGQESSRVINVKVIGQNKAGYKVSYKDMEFFMPKSLSMLKKDEKHIGKSLETKVIKASVKDGIMVSRRHLLDERIAMLKEKVGKWVEDKSVLKAQITKITDFAIFVSCHSVLGMVKRQEISHQSSFDTKANYEVGQEIEVQVIAFNEEKKSLDLSIKSLLPDPWDTIDSQVGIGDTVKGKVANIQKYGVFIHLDACDIDGFLHLSEISWDKQIKEPKQLFNIGQEVEVKIIVIDKNKKQLKLSIKQLSKDPFTEFIGQYAVGDVVEGEVVHIAQYSAFISITEFIDGMLPNAHCSWNRADSCQDLFSKGERIEVKIIEIDKEKQRVILSKKALVESPIERFRKEHSSGDVIKGVIAGIKDFGLFVTVDGKLDVFIPIEDISPLSVEEIKEGQEIEAMIIQLADKRNRVRCSVKALQQAKAKQETKEGLAKANDDVELNPLKEALNKLKQSKSDNS